MLLLQSDQFKHKLVEMIGLDKQIERVIGTCDIMHDVDAALRHTLGL